MNTAIKESLLEGARVVALAVIPLLIDGVSKWAIDWRAVAIVAIITVLRMVDKWAYESKKEGSEGIGTKLKLPF